MTRFADARIAHKFFIGFAIVFACVGCMAAALMVAVTSLDRAVFTNTAARTSAADADAALIGFYRASDAIRGYLLDVNAKNLNDYTKAKQAFADAMDRARGQLDDHPLAKPPFEALAAAAKQWFEEVGDREVSLIHDTHSISLATQVFKSGRPAELVEAVRGALTTFRTTVMADADRSQADQDTNLKRARLTLAAGTTAALLMAILVGFVLSRLIARPIAALAGAVTRLAAGDHTVDIRVTRRRDEIGAITAAVHSFKQAAIEKQRVEADADATRRAVETERGLAETLRAEIARDQQSVVDAIAQALGKLAEGDLVFRLDHPFAPAYEALRADFNRTLDQLRDTLVLVAKDASAIQAGSSEITATADDLSRRTEQQAAALEETAASLGEITATVKKTSEGAATARTVVSDAKMDAERSGDVMRKAVEAMTGIERSSMAISQTIGVIDEIAFQTNLLALNAGVEAARAGDAGRGFAVVASEVRGLAQRAAEAAKEIKVLISSSGEQVAKGVGLVAETGAALGRIVENVSTINGIIARIAAAAEEQAAGLDQVNKSITDMDRVTQQNASMVEESTAASHGLAREADALAAAIGKFRLQKEGGAPTRPSPPRPAKTVVAAKTVGRGGAAPSPAADDWEDF